MKRTFGGEDMARSMSANYVRVPNQWFLAGSFQKERGTEGSGAVTGASKEGAHFTRATSTFKDQP